ncbi:hypothetical protein [Sporosarcina sp. 6E9]|uniref:hypothetical protein n=1 Tax=Sporosarcina sp. 6E9 TaxID=2819235 RepID=UPI001B30D2BA|nr:hypothetical protein [Sporosarcina sp. 6E9]
MKMDYITAYKKVEPEYIIFFRSFLLFLTKIFDSLSTHESLPIETSNKIERNFMTSLSLLWTMHVSIFSKKVLCPKIFHNSFSQQTCDDYQSRGILPLLQQLMREVEQYPFLNEDYKAHCVNTLEQISRYYYSSTPIIVESNLHVPPPWLSSI